MNGQLIWYLARASGIVTWALLAASVIWGLALTTKALGKRPRPAWLLDLHRFLGGLAVVFLGIHMTSIALDTYVNFGPVSLLVPLTGSWHPVAVAWGIVSAYLLAAVELTSLLRSQIPRSSGAGCTTPPSRCWRWLRSTASRPALTVTPSRCGSGCSESWR